MYKLIVIFAYFVVCDACLPYNFEYGYSDNFTNTLGMCNGLSMWDLKTYSDIGLDPPHWLSEKFISPNRQQLSCVASFTFQGSERGRVDINAYMESSEECQITLMVNAVREIGDATVGSIMLGPTVTPNFYSGWHKLRIDVMEGSGNFTGYVSTVYING
ncbi:unnamed protein product [Pieris macdunnoughi]|uniref:Uncharacterized protein n=1 Tax=Pieris macdunnoughi TaxID=345717 RepID=A0A821QL92_9NEOP|nr:unnamed protein product [Pieris macdunnoughi]